MDSSVPKDPNQTEHNALVIRNAVLIEEQGKDIGEIKARLNHVERRITTIMILLVLLVGTSGVAAVNDLAKLIISLTG